MLLAASAKSAWACPMCKLALETDDPQPRAYMISILFMMGMIFTMFGLVGGLVWWLTRHERRSLEDAGYGHLFENAVTESAKMKAAVGS
jgi:hypothetical protein